MARRPERNHEAYNKSGLLNIGLTSLDRGLTHTHTHTHVHLMKLTI